MAGSEKVPLVKGSDFVTGAFVDVRPLIRLFLLDLGPGGSTGLLLRVLARLPKEESDPESLPSFSSRIGSGVDTLLFLAADLVTGPK